MRKIAIIQEAKEAAGFSAWLGQRGIEHHIGEQGSEGYPIWIYNEEDMGAAQNLLEQYQQGIPPPVSIPLKLKPSLPQKRKKTLSLWKRKPLLDLGPIGLTMAIVSFGVALVSQLGHRVDLVEFLFYSRYMPPAGLISLPPEIITGQVWRLFTPIFLHFGLLHIVFNLLWLKDLGGILENRHGSIYFLILVLVIAGISNTAQYFVSGPAFGGLSGVVYGFLGFFWIRGKCDPSYGMKINPSIVIMMLVWFVICLTGLMGPVANTVHGVGLATGMAWGYVSSKATFFKKKR